MKKSMLTLVLATLALFAKAAKVVNNTDCTVHIYVHCIPEGVCDNIGILYGPSGPFKAGIGPHGTYLIPSPYPPCSVLYPEPPPPPPYTVSATPVFEFVIENDDGTTNCPDHFISPPTYMGPNCHHNIVFPPVTASCGCLQAGQIIYVDYDPATGDYNIHY